MANQRDKKFQLLPAQKATLRPIVDPAERAALAESAKRSRRAAFSGSSLDGDLREPTLHSVLEWCRELSPEDRLLFATELVAQLSAEQRLELQERLATPLAGRASDGPS
jgi:hypothetical protein